MKFFTFDKNLVEIFRNYFASLVLSGCLLLSDVDVVQKGVKTPLSDGDYLMSSFALSLTEKDSEKLDFSSFSTDLNEPDVQPISETADREAFCQNPIHMNFQMEKLNLEN